MNRDVTFEKDRETHLPEGTIVRDFSGKAIAVITSMGRYELPISLDSDVNLPLISGDFDNVSTTSIAGLGDNTETYVNEHGGKQSKLDYRFDLLDAKALFRIAAIHDRGAKKYGEENWRNIPIREQLNHALTHIYAYLAGDTQEDHLGNAACRTLFALAVAEQGGHFTAQETEDA